MHLSQAVPTKASMCYGMSVASPEVPACYSSPAGAHLMITCSSTLAGEGDNKTQCIGPGGGEVIQLKLTQDKQGNLVHKAMLKEITMWSR